ncbi:MAG: family NAD(P)-dependent oxidoreductase [Myxococcales bacterium]|nr:family NAD(P)-dependent oxidoreductase [Myxococcales bacterium]
MAGKGKVVVITGASAGIGRATAQRFGAEGASVALLARGAAGLEGARRDVEAAGGRAIVCPTDVADPTQVEAAAARAEAELGPIDIWINCAMVTVFGQFTDLTMDEFRRVTDVTYLGYVHGTHAALSRMLPRDAGTIVQVGSALAYRAIPLQSAYCGAKHAIRGFTDSVRTELMHRKSKVWLTEVHMPAVNTPQFGWCKNKMEHKSQPVPPIYQPEVAADAVHFAAHHRRRELYVGASTAVVIAGNKLAPSVGDWYLAKTGFESQQYDGPPTEGARYNLWQPVDDESDAGSHGAFDARAHGRSAELFAVKHKGLLAAAGLGIAALALVSVLRSR